MARELDPKIEMEPLKLVFYTFKVQKTPSLWRPVLTLEPVREPVREGEEEPPSWSGEKKGED